MFIIAVFIMLNDHYSKHEASATQSEFQSKPHLDQSLHIQTPCGNEGIHAD